MSRYEGRRRMVGQKFVEGLTAGIAQGGNGGGKVAFALTEAPAAVLEEAPAIVPTNDLRDATAQQIRDAQDVLAPVVTAIYGGAGGVEALAAFDHLGRAADYLHFGMVGAREKAISELGAAVELLRSAAESAGAPGMPLTALAGTMTAVVATIETWDQIHAGIVPPRLALEARGDSFALVEDGTDVATFGTAADAIAALEGRIPPDLSAGTPFRVFIAPEGFESGDGRLLELGTTTWREPPLALMFQDTASHGMGDPDPGWFAGAITSIERDPQDTSRIVGRGNLAPGADGQRAEAMIRAGLRGLSLDGIGGMQQPPVRQVTAVDEDGQPIRALVRYSDTRILGATVVPHPAFEPCCIWFDDEPTPERVTNTHGQMIPLDTPPEVIETPALDALLASAGGPLHPPRAWFYRDEPDHYQPLTPNADGSISGHLGRNGTCHIGQVGACATIPRSETNYRHFHRTLAETAEGDKVACGWLTMGTTHVRDLHASAKATMDHYDHTGTQVAKLRVIDGVHGPWACGAIAPGLSDEMLWKMQGPEVSGDWRPIDGHYRELVACLAVPLPGFLTERPEALVASGAIVAQIGTLPCDSGCDGSSALVDGPTAEFVRGWETGISARMDLLERAVEALRPQITTAIRERLQARLEAEFPETTLDRYRRDLRVPR